MPTHAGLVVWLAVLSSLSSMAGCESSPPAVEPEPTPTPAPTPAPTATTPKAQPAPEPAVEPEPAPTPPPRLFARKYVSRVWSEPSLDSEQRGYMRVGAVVTAKQAEPVGHERCRRGWYEIAETGGFVCDMREVIAFEGDRLPDVQPAQPDRQAPLPYVYAYTTRSGTPMYKRLPTREEAMLHEDGLLPDGTPVAAAQEEAADAGAEDAGEQEPAPPPTLEELRGERGAFVRRLLQAGFYVSLDRELERDGRSYWRTMSSGHVASNRLKTIEAGSFEGVALAPGPHPLVQPAPAQDATDEAGADEATTAPEAVAPVAAEEEVAPLPAPAHAAPLHLPIGYVLGGKTVRYTRAARGALRKARELPGYHHVFEIVADERARGRDYVRDAEGYLYDARLIRRIDLAEPPAGVGPEERWIDIDLSTQSLVAYEGEVPVRATLISSGRVRGGPNSPLNHATPTGTYRILSKHVSATMDGDHAVSGPYSLEDVPYVQFFQGALALHSAFWHNRFGRAHSHGCINLAPLDALWLFGWTGPEVPGPWHAAYPEEPSQGTLIRIHGETPPG